MHGYPVMQVVQYHIPPAIQPFPHHSVPPSSHHASRNNGSAGGIRKYVFWCCICGGLATILGALFLAVYFLLRSYTSTLGYFETIPTFVPATMLILTGLCVMSLARRKNRYSYLIKVCGLCCLVCALTCVLVTITTTVIHMNRLQALRECVYTQKTRTCTCYSVLLETHAHADDGMRFVFDSTPDCEVIHGALYSCLRAMFGLSVSGILVCIFSCMLVYQLLSHEKKKMYWEQLELRCRSFYHQQSSGPASSHGSMRGPPVPPSTTTTYCSCCEECRYPPMPMPPPVGPQVYPWDAHHHPAERFWTPGRVGNFYSPNPGEENPGTTTQIQSDLRDNREQRGGGTGWNWRRLPWTRGNNHQLDNNQQQQQRDNSLTYQIGDINSSADSQYGFSNRSGGENIMAGDAVTESAGSYSILDNRPPIGGVYVWGPPPPYSNPNSPARRPLHSPTQRYPHHHHLHGHESHCQLNEFNRNSSRHHQQQRQSGNKDNYENTVEATTPAADIHHHHHHHQSNDNNNCSESTTTDTSSSCVDSRGVTSLPVRKLKKRLDMMTVQNPTPTKIFQSHEDDDGNCYHHHHNEGPLLIDSKTINDNTTTTTTQCHFLPRLQGVENAAFQKQELNNSPDKPPETSESEVYFADVSSCCNISVRNDGQDSSLYDEALDSPPQKPSCLMSLQKHQQQDQLLQNFQENISSSTVTEDEDYLAHRMGNRQQMSTRSRMPFPLPSSSNPDTITNKGGDNNALGIQLMLPIIKKDMSDNSLCSNSVQTPMTDTTDDDSALNTPVITENPVKSEQLNRGSFIDHFLAPDAQYDEIAHQEQPPQQLDTFNNIIRHNNHHHQNNNNSNLTNTIAIGLSHHQNNYYNNQISIKPPLLKIQQQQQSNNIRRSIGSNISALIQNLGAGNSAGTATGAPGLLYGGETMMVHDEEVQEGQGCHSDGTMDSGWHSGSEKNENREPASSSETVVNVNSEPPVNV